MIEPAGWDQNSTIDGKGIALLQLWLNNDPLHRFLPSLNSKDTEPNFDGYITYGEPRNNRIVPIGRVNVQVKSTSKSLINNNTTGKLNKYKYSCKTEVLFAVEQEISLDPTGLVIVDTLNSNLYWISLTQDYLENLDLHANQKSKTLFFDDAYLMKDYDEFFELLEELRKTHSRFRKTVIKNALLVNPNIAQKKMELLQDLSFDLNERCKTDLWFLKKNSFPSAWMMAIRYAEKREKVYLGIRPLCRGENDTILIGNLAVSDDPNPFRGLLTNDYDEEPFITLCGSLDRSLEEMYEMILEQWIITFSSTFMIHPSIMPDILLEEVFFWYADLLAMLIPEIESKHKQGTYPSDTFTPDKCKRLLDAPYYAGWKYWMELSNHTVLNEKGTYIASPFSENCHENNLQNSKKWIQEYIEDDSLDYETSCDFKLELKEDEVPFSFIGMVVDEITKRNLSIKRPWKCSFTQRYDDSNSTKGIFMSSGQPKDRGCSKEDYEWNLEKLFKRYTQLRENILRSFFGDNFPFEDNVYYKNITIYHNECSYCEITTFYSHKGYGSEFKIKPYCNQSIKMEESDIYEPSKIVDWSKKSSTSEMPYFTNSMPLYSLFEHDIVEVLERLFPRARIPKHRRYYGVRVSKKSFLEGWRFVLLRNK